MSRAPWARQLALASLCYVVSVNALVRCSGGDPNLLSPRFLPEKTRALGYLAVHGLHHLRSPREQDLPATVAAAARRNRVPVSLALAVARAESAWSPHAISRTGAMGLMQLMPATAGDYGATDPYDPEQNAEAASRYLRALLDRYRGDPRRVVWAYNAGPGNVPRSGPVSLPPETRVYASRVLD